MNMEIIQQSIDKMQELDKKLVKNIIRRKNFSDATKEYSEEIIRITCNRIGKYLEAIDEAIYNSEGRSNKYNSDKKNISRTITIPLGEIKFKRRRYQDKETKEYVFLLDRYLGIDLNEKSTDAVKARILDESIDTTYKKGGEKAAYNISYTKQTTKNIIDSLTPELIVAKNEDEKKEVEYLYIDADEAHVKIQKNNKVKQVLCKEIYVYEGKELEAPKSKRKRLINKWTFSGVYEKSVENADRMARLRAYKINGGNIYELIKANHEWLKGNRDNKIKFKPNNDKLKCICTKDKVSTAVIGKYYDAMQATIDNEIRYKYKLNF